MFTFLTVEILYRVEPFGTYNALIAQLGERKTEDLEALCSIHSQGITFGFDEVDLRSFIIVNLFIITCLHYCSTFINTSACFFKFENTVVV